MWAVVYKVDVKNMHAVKFFASGMETMFRSVDLSFRSKNTEVVHQGVTLLCTVLER